MPPPSAHHHVQPGPAAPAATPSRALAVGLALTAGFAVVEAIGGWLAGSLALISDAGHMVTDAASFVVALVASALARRPPTQRASYGYARAEVLGLRQRGEMLALIVWIAVEAYGVCWLPRRSPAPS
jgi:cobalt-zinc-cadmium efflux system protein